MKSNKFVLGVTGGVGCGKSQVTDHLKNAYGATALILDDMAKELWIPGGPCYDEVVSLFGEDIVCDDGTCDRSRIAARVFKDPGLLEKMNSIIHPAVRKEVGRILDVASDGSFAVIESAILFESGYADICDETWFIYASEKTRRKRLTESRGYSAERISSIMECQADEETLRENCDIVIDNDGSFERTKAIIDKRVNDEILQHCQREQR